MTEQGIAELRFWVLSAAFVASAAFGAISLRTNFCTMGAISDAVLMGSYVRARQWACAVAVAIFGFGLMVSFGWINPDQTLYSSNKLLWASAGVGGGLFGFGMVLASGCGSKTLVRIGSGNLKSLVVFLVMGLAAFATLKGITAVVRVATVDRAAIDFGVQASLFAFTSHWLGGRATGFGLVGALVAVAMLAFCWADREFREFENWIAGLGIGLIVVLMWFVSGALGFVAEHPDTLQTAYLATSSGRIEAMSFVAPVAHTLDWLLYFSDKSKILTFGVVSVAGVIAGSFAMALFTKTFRWEGFRDARDTGLHMVGAVLMGIGGVTAMGCTIGQGLSGLSTLSFMSMLAVVGIVAGAVMALKFQNWLIERDA